MLHGYLIKLLSITLLNFDGTLRAFAKTGAKPVAVLIADKPCLAIDDLERALGTGYDAQPAAIALLLIDMDDFSCSLGCRVCHLYFPLFFLYCCLLLHQPVVKLIADTLPGIFTVLDT